MSYKNPMKPLSAALGVSFVVSLAASPLVNAESNPFEMTELSGGYMIADAHAEGKCGEGKCGENKNAEGKCGEGKCGENKKAEGKCGEGKCGSKGVDMKGNVVDLGDNFTFGGDNMAKYADGKLGTGVKDPAVCGTYTSE